MRTFITFQYHLPIRWPSKILILLEHVKHGTFWAVIFVRKILVWIPLNQNLRHITDMRYPKYTIVTIHAHGSPYVLIVEGRGPWTVFWDVASCMLCLLSVLLCYVILCFVMSLVCYLLDYSILFKNSLIIHEENTKKNHKRVVSLYVDKDFPSFT
jgi:hypothetical protein